MRLWRVNESGLVSDYEIVKETAGQYKAKDMKWPEWKPETFNKSRIGTDIFLDEREACYKAIEICERRRDDYATRKDIEVQKIIELDGRLERLDK